MSSGETGTMEYECALLRERISSAIGVPEHLLFGSGQPRRYTPSQSPLVRVEVIKLAPVVNMSSARWIRRFDRASNRRKKLLVRGYMQNEILRLLTYGEIRK